MAVTFLVVHLVICVLVTFVCLRTAPSGEMSFALPVVWLVPAAGCALFWAEWYLQKRVPDEARGYGKAGTLTEEADTVEEDVNQDESLIVPMEEAMVEESEEIRRRLMFHLLEAKESDNIRLLQKITASDDVELAHFASTRMMSFRREHEQDIAQKAKRIAENPEDRVTLEQYCALLKEYIDSGMLPGALLKTYREALKDAYEKLIAVDPKDMDHREAYIQFLMDADMPDETVSEAVETTMKLFPAEMRSYQLAVAYGYRQKNLKAMDVILEQVRERNVYLNQAGRRWYAFWRGEAE
ncbi:MAG: hypothetical protein IJR00_11305 [Lachnospiraceae bacterium]|nr:hypothetical protein [Lachnospiraceae bacterium]